jgi:hypothetical protein
MEKSDSGIFVSLRRLILHPEVARASWHIDLD